MHMCVCKGLALTCLGTLFAFSVRAPTTVGSGQLRAVLVESENPSFLDAQGFGQM